MIPFEIARELHEVPESIIREYARHFEEEGNTNNSFSKLLEYAQVFRHAETKPIFLANQDGTSFAVSSDKTFMKKLH